MRRKHEKAVRGRDLRQSAASSPMQARQLRKRHHSATPAARAELLEREGTLANAAYRRLRSDIMVGALRPNERLRMHELRTRYDVGVAPLREALCRLQAEGLVSASDHRGFWVTPTSLEELRDLTRVRILVETTALREAIASGDDQWEAAIVAAFHRLARATERELDTSEETLSEWEALHDDFHRALMGACGSPLLLRVQGFLSQLASRYRVYRVIGRIRRDHFSEHKALMEAVLARDATRAAQLLAEHYENSAKLIARQFTQTGRTESA